MSDPITLVLQPAPAVAVQVAAPPVIGLQLAVAQGPAGPGGSGSAAPVAVSVSRALTADDAGRMLQLAHGVTVTVPAGLPASFVCQLLCNASQVVAGGSVTLSAAAGASVNGSPAGAWTVERAVGSTAPWMGWLQHETGADAYSLVVIGATVTAIVGASDVYEAGVYEIGIYE